MILDWTPLTFVILTFCIYTAQPSLDPELLKPYNTDCNTLRMGQFICPDPTYDLIDPETQQLRKCTKDNVALGLTLYFYNYCFNNKLN